MISLTRRRALAFLGVFGAPARVCAFPTSSPTGVPLTGISPAEFPPVSIDPASARKLTALLALMPAERGTLARLEAISRAFLGTPYGGHRLIGGPQTPERLTVDFRALDCLSYLEYVVALTQAVTQEEFYKALIQTRYKNETVRWATRRHFFSDWTQPAPLLADNVTARLSPLAQSVTKDLNVRANGSLWLPGVTPRLQNVTWLPLAALTPNVLAHLKTGDLLGSYTPEAGLDVTHTGFAISTPSGVLFRNASSLPSNERVVDVPLERYMSMKKRHGLVVLRLRME